jgi:hypothetical protein
MRFNLIKGKQIEMIQFKITPDRTVDNKRNHDLFRNISSAFYASPLDSITGKKTCGLFWWDIMVSSTEIQFYCTIQKDYERESILYLTNTWQLASIEKLKEKETFIPVESDVCEMKLRRNNIFAIQTDRRFELEPLNSILAISNELETNDIARFSVCIEPISRVGWQDWAERMHKQFRDGKTPKRTRLNKRDILLSTGNIITSILQSALDVVYSVVGGDENKPKNSDDLEKKLIMIDGSLSRGTLNKIKSPTFNTYIRIASHSENKDRQKIILRTISNSFNDITADNEIERQEYHSKLKPKIIHELNNHKLSWVSKFDFDKNIMSNEELGRIIELPSPSIQDIYSNKIDSIESRQTEVPALLTKKGIKFGDVEFKKVSFPVYMPIEDEDQLCLPSCYIGGMGSGKTTGAINKSIQFVENGFSALVVDPAKGEMFEKISKILPPEKINRIVLGEVPISLDFREVIHSSKAKASLSDIMMSFFETNNEEATQTERFVKAAVMGMEVGKFEEIIKIFKDETHRKKVISKMENEFHRETLEEYHNSSEPMQRKILSPIMNRLDGLLGHDYLYKCMKATEGIDMVKILSERGKCTIIDVPDKLNTRFAKNILINLISLKIDVAMGLRSEEFPFSICYDEPHQYLKSAKLWENVSVESRKYRLAYSWMFHSWEQLPRHLAQIIKDANPHYFIYQSSKETYKSLSDEIYPFTVEDGLRIPRWSAIVAMKFGVNRMTPFLCKMSSV